MKTAQFAKGVAYNLVQLLKAKVPCNCSRSRRRGKMLYLYIFGDNVEDRMGPLPYQLSLLPTLSTCKVSVARKKPLFQYTEGAMNPPGGGEP